MKFPSFIVAFLSLLASASFVNSQTFPNPPVLVAPGESSNLGVQEIVEIGVPLEQEQVAERNNTQPEVKPTVPKQLPRQTPTPSVPPSGSFSKGYIPVTPDRTSSLFSEMILGTRPQSTEVYAPIAIPRSADSSPIKGGFIEQPDAPQIQEPPTGELPFNLSAQAGMRTYWTSNALRQPSELAESSGVLETNIGAGIGTKPLPIGEYVTLIPRLDLFMQFANYQEYSEFLDYRFGMIKGGLQFGLPRDWSIGFSLDYNVLHNMDSGDRTFGSLAPTLSVQKLFPVTDVSLLMIDSSMRFSFMDADNIFPAAGIFSDSGNNIQNSLSVSYLHQFGENRNWIFMPRILLSATNYTKSPNEDRTDLLFSLGTSLLYQFNEWFGLQVFWTYSSMSSDTIDSFNAHDLGAAFSGSYRF